MFRGTDATLLQIPRGYEGDIEGCCKLDDIYVLYMIRTRKKILEEALYYASRYSSIHIVFQIIRWGAVCNHWGAYGAGERGCWALIRYFIQNTHPHMDAPYQAFEGAVEGKQNAIAMRLADEFGFENE